MILYYTIQEPNHLSKQTCLWTFNGVTYNLSQNTTSIGPSQTLEQKGILNAAVVYGNSYTVRVSATTSDGSTFVTSRQINAG